MVTASTPYLFGAPRLSSVTLARNIESKAENPFFWMMAVYWARFNARSHTPLATIMTIYQRPAVGASR